MQLPLYKVYFVPLDRKFATSILFSKNKNQFNASINAQFRAGQMAGLFIDKREINVSGIEGMSRESLEKRLQELESKINENKKIIDITPEEIIEEQ